jgi:dihydroorotase
VIDPANHIDDVRDVAVFQGKIAAVEKNIPAEQAGKVVDASKLYVTPGLIDIHYHVGHGGAPLNWFAPDARAHAMPLGIAADLALESGVTTIVDAGSAGAETFLLEKEEVIDTAKVRVLAFLNIEANGMNGGLEQSLDEMDPKLCAATIKKYPDLIVGVKTAHFWTAEPWDAEHVPWAAVDRAIECRTRQCSRHVRFLAAAGKDLRGADTEENEAGRHTHPRFRPAISHYSRRWQNQSHHG